MNSTSFDIIKITTGDVIWSYISRFFSMFSGIVILPFILNKLSTEEIALYYLLLIITSLINLFDFGFAPQFARNITYVYSGAKHLKNEGVDIEYNKSIDFHLLKTVIETAKYIYKRTSFAVLFFIVTIGSIYVYRVTGHFEKVHNMLYIWIIYIISTYFNFYFIYYNSLLIGRGYIKESQKANIYSKSVNIIITLTLLFIGCRLFSIVIANFISPFISRYLSYHYFYDKTTKDNLQKCRVPSIEKQSMVSIIWYNAKKIGIVSLASFAVSQSGLFFAGLYLPLKDVASYGLMVQIVGTIAALSSTLVNIQSPLYSSCRVQNNNKKLLKHFSFAIDMFYLLYIFGFIALISIIPSLLIIIKSNTLLPSMTIVCIYSLFMLLESNHGNFAIVIASNNNIPYLKAAVISGILVIIGIFIILKYTSYGFWGLIIIPAIIQAAYQNWKWPLTVCKELKISYYKIITMGGNEIKTAAMSMIKK